MNISKSQSLFERAQAHIPGGVNSPVRAFKGVGGTPLFIKKSKDAYLWDEDEQRYIDYVGSWGAMVVGHAHDEVIEAVQAACAMGLSYGAPTEVEVKLAEKICQCVPSIESVRMTCSGTEATMSAIRLARGYTNRSVIIKFEGGYHGHSDSLLVKAGSGALTLGEPNSPGVPEASAQLTLTLDYNNIEQVREVFDQMGDQIAAIIVEPVCGNMNCVPPQEGFLQGLRALCHQHGALLIFDEVMTGFRVALGGAQSLYDVQPDLTTLGKVIGGGMPVGALGGRKDIMECLSPVGSVYQAGTLSGNPIAMTAGLKTLEIITRPGFYEALNQKTQQLIDGLSAQAEKASVPFMCQSVGGMFGLFFTKESHVHSYKQAMDCDKNAFSRFFHAMLANGVYLAPSAFEAGFMSAKHSDADIEQTIAAAQIGFASLT